MKQTRILLLDFGSAGSLSNGLSRVLASTPDLAIRVQPGILSNKSIPSGLDPDVLIGDSDPKVVFLILPRHLLKPSRPLLRSLKKANAALPLIVVTEAAEAEEIFALLELGVSDFIAPPLRAFDILPRIWRLIEQKPQHEMLLSTLKEKLGLKMLIGESETFRAAVSKIPLIARCDAGTLISGETGTGKELFARAIHYLSPRAQHPFVPVNCGAIPVELVENELFGHERGAFTDAAKSQPGLIQEADGGSLFLDEVDELHPAAQIKMLRFLQDKEYRPLGSGKPRIANVRIIAATNADLEEAAQTGKLRRDLYYRLNVIPLRLPPLRERREDIPALTRHFLVRYAAEFRKTVTDISADALRCLRHYHWPGNVRELEHLIARATALSENATIESEDLGLPGQSTTVDPTSYREAKAQFERAYIEDLLLVHEGNISKAALAAHKNRRAFWELIRKYHIDVAGFKAGTRSRSASG